MNTVCQCNKEKKRNTHLRVKEVSWNIAPLLSYLRNMESPPPPPQNGVSIGRPDLALGDSIFSTCNSHQIQAPCGGGGVAWVALWWAFPQTQESAFWRFLRSYLTSGPFSCWYFLLLKKRIFWYYFSRQVMAILCYVAQKAASAANRQ